MNASRPTDSEGYNALLAELITLQVQINSSKPMDLKRLLDRQLALHNLISNRITELAYNNQIMPIDAFQSIVRPPYVITFLLQKQAQDYAVTVHCISNYCTL